MCTITAKCFDFRLVKLTKITQQRLIIILCIVSILYTGHILDICISSLK